MPGKSKKLNNAPKKVTMRKITVLRIVANAIKTPVSIDITSCVSISHTLRNYVTLLIHFIQCI